MGIKMLTEEIIQQAKGSSLYLDLLKNEVSKLIREERNIKPNDFGVNKGDFIVAFSLGGNAEEFIIRDMGFVHRQDDDGDYRTRFNNLITDIEDLNQRVFKCPVGNWKSKSTETIRADRAYVPTSIEDAMANCQEIKMSND